MGELKFSCTKCGQHIAADDAWRGQKLNCPACQKELVVPNARTLPPPIPTTPQLARPAAPPVVREPSPAPSPPVKQARKDSLCVLAPVALLLVLATPLVALFQRAVMPAVPLTLLCLIAGLVCGHVALRRIRSNPGQTGTVWALIGLAAGYLLVLVVTVGVGYSFAVKQGWIRPVQARRGPAGFPGRRATIPPRPPTSPAEPLPRPSMPPSDRGTDGSRPTLPSPVRSQTSTIPVKNTVGGQLAGQPFRCDRARLRGTMLELGQGNEFIPGTSVTVFTRLMGDAAGRRVVVPAETGGLNPHINLKWRENGRIRSSPVRDGFTLRLEFGQPSGNLIPGNIELEIPGTPGTKLAGEFTAEMR